MVDTILIFLKQHPKLIWVHILATLLGTPV